MSFSKWMNNLCFALIMASDFSVNRGRLKSTKLSYMVTLTQTLALSDNCENIYVFHKLAIDRCA